MENRKESYQKKGYIHEKYHYFHLNDQAGQEADYHFHDFDKMVLLLSGNVTYALEHEEYAMKPWDILLVPHHTIHKVSIDMSVPYERIIIYFNRMYLRSLAPSEDIMHAFKHARRSEQYLLRPTKDQKKLLLPLFEQLEAQENPLSFGHEIYRDSYMMQLLVHLGRIHSSQKGQYLPKVDDKIKETLSYINEHLTEELSVDLLASQVYLSRSYFMHLFKKETGNSVYATITQKRLLYAARKIREGTPITEAVIESGFSDYSSFYKSFKAQFGISPRELGT